MIDDKEIKIGDIVELDTGQQYNVTDFEVTTNSAIRKVSFTCSGVIDEAHLTIECYTILSDQSKIWRLLSEHPLDTTSLSRIIKQPVNQPDTSGHSGNGFTFSPA